jgi:predicted extracellular nuclease
MEIENDIHDDEAVYPNQAHDPVIQLVAALNAAEAAAGSGFTWDWDIANYYNNYPVRNEIIYRNTVTPYGPPVALQDVAFDGVRPYSRSPLDPVGRPPVAQTFIDSTGEMFTVVANHFKSKGSGCDDGVFDPVTGDLLWLDPGSDNGQGNCPLTRVRQSEAMMAWLATDPTGAGDPDVLIIGDLNSYTMEDPIDVIEAAGYTNLVKHFEGMYAYSYVFDGQLGNLDHALGSASIMSQVTGTAAWHINSDEPDILDYDTSFKKDKQDQLYEQNAFRASDHDPVIVGLDLGVRISATPDTLWAPNHKYVNVEVSANRGSGAELTVVITGVASSENDSGYSKGDMPDDVGNIDGNMVELRAERYTLEGRTYTVHVDLYDDGAYVTSGTVDVVVPHDQREVKPTTN